MAGEDLRGPNDSEMQKAYLELLNWRILLYSKIEKRMRITYVFIRLVSAIGSILIPVIANAPIPLTIGANKIDFWKLSVTALGLVVAVAIAIEGVLRYRERCLEFSKAKRLLRTQLNFFRSGAEDYVGISQQEAFQKLVVRAEGIISDLQESSIGVLTRVESDQPQVKQQPGP